MHSMHISEAEPVHSPEIIPVDSSDMEPKIMHTELSPLSDSLFLIAPSPRLSSSYIPSMHSSSSKATSQSPAIAPSPRLPIDQVIFWCLFVWSLNNISEMWSNHLGPLSIQNQEVSPLQSPMFPPSPRLLTWALASNPIIESRSPSIHGSSPWLPQLTFTLALHDNILDAPSPQLPLWQSVCSSTTGVEPPTGAQKLSPEKWSPIAPSPLLLSMANLDMSVHNIHLPFHQYQYPGSLKMSVFSNHCKSILHLSEDMMFATRTCTLTCCKPVVAAEAPNMSPDEAWEKLQSWFCLGLNCLKELAQNWGQHRSQQLCSMQTTHCRHTHHSPIWVLTLWWVSVLYAHQLQEWRSAITGLFNIKTPDPTNICTFLRNVAWDYDGQAHNIHLHETAQPLHKAWLSSSILSAMISIINSEIQAEGQIILDTYFVEKLQKDWQTESILPEFAHQRLQLVITNKNIMTISILLHAITAGPVAFAEAGANLWVSSVINLAGGGVYYGDSLGYSMHQSTRKLLEAYIAPIVPLPTHHSLRHVTQIENWSCRDFALRSVCHHLNPDCYPVLAHRQSVVLVNWWSWFARLIHEFDEKICFKC